MMLIIVIVFVFVMFGKVIGKKLVLVGIVSRIDMVEKNLFSKDGFLRFFIKVFKWK